MSDAISKKTKRIPPRQRMAITLVLDATETPWQAFFHVVEVFKANHLSKVQQLGFSAIWVVAPKPIPPQRLDIL